MNRHNIVPFGTTPAGETVYKIHLQNQDLSCDILTYGATLQSLVVPDRDGQRVDVLLGVGTAALAGMVHTDIVGSIEMNTGHS